MKSITSLAIYIKSLASMIFSGLIILYMVAGWLYWEITKVPFSFTIPFIFLIQGVFLSLAISILWYVFLSDNILKKLHYSIRLVLFVFLLVFILTVCLLTFYAQPTNWAKLWLIVASAIVCGTTAISIIGEIYFKMTGKRYTEILDLYKKGDIKKQ